VKRRILVVEDDVTLRQVLTFSLGQGGYEVASAGDGESGLAAAQSGRHDLILLDLMLPSMSGLEVLRTLRRDGVSTPVIILSAKAGEVDLVVGLKIGADDYVTKPFSRPELLARIEAVLRRQRREGVDAEPSAGHMKIGPLEMDLERREVTISGQAEHLTTKEFELLAYLAANPGRIFTRDALLSRIWGYDYAGDGRTVDVHVSWLRGKLRRGDGRNWFRTVRGVGYAFSPPAG
jgi:two-component system, OmpR family, alkaline phosphatase synthesis response regulator PhoP